MKRQHIIMTLSFLFTTMSVLAQGGPPATPIDGGLSFLLAAGGAYGFRQLIKPKKS